MLYSQTYVDNIESNISSIAVDTSGAAEELRTASDYQRKAGRRAACLMIVIAIVVCIVLIAVSVKIDFSPFACRSYSLSRFFHDRTYSPYVSFYFMSIFYEDSSAGLFMEASLILYHPPLIERLFCL